jgi:hypothetical protein
MDNVLNAIIIFLTLSLTIIPITGNLWSRKGKKLKIFLRGKIFILTASIALLIGIIQVIRSSNEQRKRDSAQNKTLGNTEEIIGNVETSAQKIEKTLIRIDSLSYKLDSLEIKTNISIERRKDILNNFNRLNSQLERIYRQQDLKIKENAPNINILEEVKWIREYGINKIEITFSNSGERPAKNFNLGVIFFATDNSNKIINYKYLTDNLLGVDDLPSTNKTQMNLRFHFPNYPQNSSNDTIPAGYIYIYYNYLDFATEKIYHKNDKYIWRGTKLDGLTWISMPKSISDYVEKYIKENKIELKTTQNMLNSQ